MTPFGLALYNWRCENNLDQRGAARRLNVSQAAVANWEKGNRNPRGTTLAKVGPLIGYTAGPETNVEEEVTPIPPFTERLEAQRRAERLDAYMARNREQINARVAEAQETSNNRDKLIRLAGFLEGLQTALKVDLQEQIITLNEIIEED